MVTKPKTQKITKKKHMEIIKLKRRSDLAYVCTVDYGSGKMEVIHFIDMDRSGTIPKRTIGTAEAIKSATWTKLEKDVCKWVNQAFGKSKTTKISGKNMISVQPELDFFEEKGRKWFQI